MAFKSISIVQILLITNNLLKVKIIVRFHLISKIFKKKKNSMTLRILFKMIKIQMLNNSLVFIKNIAMTRTRKIKET